MCIGPYVIQVTQKQLNECDHKSPTSHVALHVPDSDRCERTRSGFCSNVEERVKKVFVYQGGQGDRCNGHLKFSIVRLPLGLLFTYLFTVYLCGNTKHIKTSSRPLSTARASLCDGIYII